MVDDFDKTRKEDENGENESVLHVAKVPRCQVDAFVVGLVERKWQFTNFT